MSADPRKFNNNSKPKALPVCAEGIPDWLRRLDRWVLWRYAPRGADWSKEPIRVLTRDRASTTNSDTWCGFGDALAVYRRTKGDYAGVGFVLGLDEASGLQLAGVDLDDVVSPDTREILPRFVSLVGELGRYGHVEYSPSGTGIKAIVPGTIDATLGNRSPLLDDGASVEVYGVARYFAVTGRVVGEPCNTPADASELVRRIQREFCGERKARKPSATTPTVACGSSSLPDSEILERMFASKNGAELRRLFSGDMSGHDDDHSKADQALANSLMWWCQNDATQADRLFRQSGLMRAKWDRPTAGTTYGAMTLQTATDPNGGYMGGRTVRRKNTPAPTGCVSPGSTPEGAVSASLPATPPAPLETYTLDTVDPEPVRWLVPGYLPRGKIVVFSGDGAAGKSSIANDIIARLSTGQMPFGLHAVQEYPPVDALLFALEDDPKDTLAPRLRAAEADLGRVHILKDMLDLRDVCPLRETLRSKPDIRLLVVDPIGSALAAARVDGNKEAEVRSILDPVAVLAAEMDVTVLLLAHVGKGEDRKAAHRTLGSVAITNVSRAVFSVARDTEDQTTGYICPAKFNLGQQPAGLRFRSRPLDEIEKELAMFGWARKLNDEDRQELEKQLFKVDWLGTTSMSADALGAKPTRSAERQDDLTKAAAWLREYLRDGPKPSEEVVERGNADLGLRYGTHWWRVKVFKETVDGRAPYQQGRRWYWELKQEEDT